MILSLIAAIGNQNQIGLNKKLPWNLKDDLVNFKKITEGHTVIFGRKTFESIGKPLSNRNNIIITRNKKYKIENCSIFNDLKNAIEYSKNENEVFICGGSEIYNEVFNKNFNIEKLYITFVDYDGPSDTKFPEINFNDWKLEFENKYIKNENNDYNFSLRIYRSIHL